MAWAEQSSMNSFGTFSTPTFYGVGEPYVDAFSSDPRTKGKQFTTNRSRGGQTGDNWNRTGGRWTDFKRLYDGETQVDPFIAERRFKAEEKKRNLTADGFRYSNPNGKSSGLGGYWGCIGPKHAHEPDYEVLQAGAKPTAVTHENRQVLTAPSRKGWGNTPGIIFGPGPRKGEPPKNGGEYRHLDDPYSLASDAERAQRKHTAEMRAGRPPFRSMSRSLDFFDCQPKVAASLVYTEDPMMPAKPEPEKAEAISLKPFYPSKAPSSGPQGTFMKFPEYKEDPLDLKLKALAEEVAAAKRTGPAFKPPSKPKSMRVTSVLFHEAGSH